MPQPITVARDGAIATVTLNNPGKRNALNKPMWEGLRDTMAGLSEDDQLACVVVRGAGEEAFAAGADISEFETVRADAEQARAYDAVLREALDSLRQCVHPTLAMIRGACVGGGLQIAMHCDLRISGESGRFGAPVARLGMSMPCPEIAALVEVGGPAVALEILLEGRVFGAEEALAKGLLTRVVADDQLEAETQATARRIAAGAPLVGRWHKRFVHRLAAGGQVDEAAIEEGYFYFGTEDFREGVAAFLEKRRPHFKGR